MNNYNYDWYRHMNGNGMNGFHDEDMNGFSMNSNNQLFNPKEAFKRGNLFKSLYSPYKNYQPVDLKSMNDREKMLCELSEVAFAAHDLNLYLDMNPDDQSMFMLFRDYQKQANRLMEEYERRYGPLMVNDEEMNESFTWSDTKWPWEGRNV